jgi:hypothetical protein
VATRDGKGTHDYRAGAIDFPRGWLVLTPEQRQEVADLLAPVLLRMVSALVDSENDGGARVRGLLRSGGPR